MNSFVALLIYIYSKLLLLYPQRFQNEFTDEMQVVFGESLEEAIHEGTLSFAFVCLKELGGLPFNILREFWHELKGRETVMVTNESTTNPSVREEKMTRGEIILGTLPFALYGLVSMLTKTEFPFWSTYLSFFIVTLLGLLIGVVKGFPRWTYSYLGWSMVMSWYWTMMPIYIKNVYSPVTHNQLWGWWAWIPLLITILVGMLFAGSLRPLRDLASGIWQNWTFLSLMMYTFAAFTLLIYDENHHPYLLAFMAASTLVICMTVWVFLQSASSWKRVIALIAGFVVTLILSNISYLNNISYVTGDYAAYYGLPPSPPQPWYTALNGVIDWTILYSGIMFWPALVGLVRSVTKGGKTA